MSHIIIQVKMKDKIARKKVEGKSIIRDGVALTTYTDPKITQRSFKAMQEQGKECALKGGILVERYADMKMKKIADRIESDLKQISEKLEKIMEVNYTRKFIR